MRRIHARVEDRHDGARPVKPDLPGLIALNPRDAALERRLENRVGHDSEDVGRVLERGKRRGADFQRDQRHRFVLPDLPALVSGNASQCPRADGVDIATLALNRLLTAVLGQHGFRLRAAGNPQLDDDSRRAGSRDSAAHRLRHNRALIVRAASRLRLRLALAVQRRHHADEQQRDHRHDSGRPRTRHQILQTVLSIVRVSLRCVNHQ
jgi:hypothetical protein